VIPPLPTLGSGITAIKILQKSIFSIWFLSSKIENYRDFPLCEIQVRVVSPLNFSNIQNLAKRQELVFRCVN